LSPTVLLTNEISPAQQHHRQVLITASWILLPSRGVHLSERICDSLSDTHPGRWQAATKLPPSPLQMPFTLLANKSFAPEKRDPTPAARQEPANRSGRLLGRWVF